MPKRLNDFDNKRYESIVDFMHAIKEAGFENDMDNGRIMKTFSSKMDEIWAKVERKGSYFITTKCRHRNENQCELEVTFQSDIDETATAQIILFVRPERDSIAIRRDVLEETIVVGKGDIAYTGSMFNYEGAKKLFEETGRFSSQTMVAFECIVGGISGLSPDPTEMKISPMINGMHVAFVNGGKTVSSVRFEYSK